MPPTNTNQPANKPTHPACTVAAKDERETAVALYRQAHQYFLDQEYALATQLAQEALIQANQLEDENMKVRCNRLLSHVDFLSR